MLRLLGIPVLAIIFLAAAEMGSRLDDLVFDKVSFAAQPTSQDLVVNGRGLPYAHFKKWHLNSNGFRSPELAAHLKPGCKRIFVLGASETFGLYESPDSEFPALLRTPCDEFVNVAVVGMTIPSMFDYWQYLRQFHPDEVIIYPPTQFYLASELKTRAPRHRHANVAQPAPFRSRFLDRLRDVIDTPDYIQVRGIRKVIAEEIAKHDQEWTFKTVPPERLNAFSTDLSDLVNTIRADGVRVHLMTHAVKFRETDNYDSARELLDVRIFTPRASGKILLEFNSAANDAIRSLASTHHADVIDIANDLTGCHSCFGDLVHFTDEGSKRVAAIIKKSLGSELYAVQ